MKGEMELSMEKLFVELIEAGEEEELFSTRSREGIFSPALVMWLEVSRRVGGRKSLLGALESLQSGNAVEVLRENHRSKAAKRGEISMNSGGLCRARQRLRIEKVEKLCRLISGELLREAGSDALWHGRRVYLMDGTTVTLARSDKTFAKYAPITNQYRSSGTSTMVCTCIHDLFTGVALSPAFGPFAGTKAVGETTLAKTMLSRLNEAGVVVGDRGFGIFGVAWTAWAHGHDILVRLTSNRAKGIRKDRHSTEDCDEKITWNAGNLSKHPEISADAKIPGRFVQRTIQRPGFRSLRLLFFTTLTEPVEELIALYEQRERIENDIRSLKHTLGLEMLNSKSPDVLEKELLLGFAAYNLLRAVLARAACKLKISARKISFSRGAALVRIFGNQLRDATNRTAKNAILVRFLTALNQSKLPTRTKRRLEPRKIVRAFAHFPLMKNSREEERKLALEVAQKHGHRGYYSTISRKY